MEKVAAMTQRNALMWHQLGHSDYTTFPTAFTALRCVVFPYILYNDMLISALLYSTGAEERRKALKKDGGAAAARRRCSTKNATAAAARRCDYAT